MSGFFNMADGHLTGFEAYFLSSEQYADKIIEIFKLNYTGEEDPNQLLAEIADTLKLSQGDLLPDSKARIEMEIHNDIARY